jgi:hypothetical protein
VALIGIVAVIAIPRRAVASAGSVAIAVAALTYTVVVILVAASVMSTVVAIMGPVVICMISVAMVVTVIPIIAVVAIVAVTMIVTVVAIAAVTMIVTVSPMVIVAIVIAWIDHNRIDSPDRYWNSGAIVRIATAVARLGVCVQTNCRGCCAPTHLVGDQQNLLLLILARDASGKDPYSLCGVQTYPHGDLRSIAGLSDRGNQVDNALVRTRPGGEIDLSAFRASKAA